MGATGPSGGFDIQNFFSKNPAYPQSAQFQGIQPNQFHNPPQTFPPNQFPSNAAPFPPTAGNPYPFNPSAPPPPPPPPTQQAPNMYQGYHQFQQEQHASRPPPYPNGPFSPSQPAPYSQPQVPSQSSPRASQLQQTNPEPKPPTLPSLSLPQSTGPNASQIAGSTPLDGARLMALLTTHSATEGIADDDILSLSSTESSPVEVSSPAPAISPAAPTAPPLNAIPPPSRIAGSKVPKGRFVSGERIVYDVDVRLPGEAQPQLEVNPITVYGSDPVLVAGKQIAVNKNYVCYALRAASIRILNINTALRALLRGHADRLSDMSFLNENSNLLASASTDGRVIVRQIAEGRAEDQRVIITEHVVAAIQFVGDWDTCHPRLCWHSHIKDLLVVAIGKYVVTMDVAKVRAAGPSGGFSIDEPSVCRVESPLEGVSVVGTHTESVTDLGIPEYSSTRIASSSQDGMVQVWGDKKRSPLSIFTPHEGEAVGTVAFMSAPLRSEHSVLLTAGPLNREIKLWAPEPDGPPSRSGSTMWQCLQTLEFESPSCGGKLDNAFFNHVVIASRGGLIMVANAKRNAIYTVHVAFGSTLMATKINYISAFSVTMPILSLTITEDNVTEKGDGTIQIYCVQTQAIQRYPLPMSQCLPPLEEPLKQGMSKVSDIDPSAGAVEKTVTSVVNKVSQTATAVSNSPQALSVPQRSLERHNSAGFGDLSDEAGPHRNLLNATSEATKFTEASRFSVSLATRELNNERKSSYVTTQVTQPVPERVMQTSTIPTSQRVPQTEPTDAGPPPPINIARSSPSPKDQHFVPVTTGQRQLQPEKVDNFGENRNRYVPLMSEKVDNSMESRGRYTPPAAEKIDNSAESRRYNQITSDSPRKAEDSRDTRQFVPVSAGMVRHGVEKQEGSGENWTDSTAVPNSLERTSSESSTSSLGEDLMDKEETNTNQASIQKQTGPIPPHLITPSELMSLAAGTKSMEYENEQVTTDEKSKDLKGSGVKATETNLGQLDAGVLDLEPLGDDNLGSDQSESSLKVETGSTMDFTDRGNKLNRGDSLVTSDFELHDAYGNEDVQQAEEAGLLEERDRPIPADDIQEQFREMILNGGTDTSGMPPLLSQVKTKRNKNKTSGVSGGAAPMTLSSNSAGMNPSSLGGLGEGGTNSNIADLGVQIASMQESLSQLISMQSELQKQMTVTVAVPVAKEGKRMEGSLGQRMEKVLKAHVDAMWARVAEESAKREKAERERVQQVNTILNNLVSRDMPFALERGFKKEFGALGPTVTQAVLPPLQKAISTAVTETFQKGLSEKVVPQLEKLVGSKLEGNIARQLQLQFQTVGKQALQDTLRTCFENSLVPSFEHSCQDMFNQVEGTFERGMAEHTANAQKQFASSHSALASTLKDTVVSASLLAESLKVDLLGTHKKLVEYVEHAGATAAHSALVSQTTIPLPDQVLSLQILEESLDPTVKLSKLLSENKLEEAFTVALSSSNVNIVSWLCDQVDPVQLFATSPLPLSQGVLLSLVQQLGYDLSKDTGNKLTWIREAALALNLDDPVLSPHMRPFLQQLYQNLHNQMGITGPGDLASAMRLVIHVVNSLLTSCK